MSKLTIQQYNDIKKEAIDKFIEELAGNAKYNQSILSLLKDTRKKVFDKLDKRQEKNRRRGVTMIHLTTHGEIEA